VHGLYTFLAVRHGGGGGNRGHTWVLQATGQAVEDYMQSRPLLSGGPPSILPAWAIEFYRCIQRELLNGSSLAITNQQ